jgi:hypothetical protein
MTDPIIQTTKIYGNDVPMAFQSRSSRRSRNVLNGESAAHRMGPGQGDIDVLGADAIGKFVFEEIADFELVFGPRQPNFPQGAFTRRVRNLLNTVNRGESRPPLQKEPQLPPSQARGHDEQHRDDHHQEATEKRLLFGERRKRRPENALVSHTRVFPVERRRVPTF